MPHAPARLLLPFDGAPGALRALDLIAGYEGDKAAIAVTLLSVQTRPVSLWPSPGLEPGAIDAALLEAAQRSLAAPLERLQRAGLDARVAVRLGSPAQIILREAQTHDALAVLMGTRGKGALQGSALGSVTLRVAHGGATPSIIVGPDARLPSVLGKRLRVMLAVDGSEPPLRAAQRLAAWRYWLGELEVHLVHVQQPLTMLQTILPPHDDVIAQWSTAQGEEAAQGARALFERAGIKCRLHLSVGDAALEVVHVAEHAQCELVVLGTRGLGAAHHALVGSVALKAATLARVPVLLVP